MKSSRVGIYKFLKKYKETGTVQRQIGSGRPTKITAEIKALVEQQMSSDDETTAHQLHQLISREGRKVSLSHSLALLDIFRLDFQRQQLLSVKTGSKQTKAFGVGPKEQR